MSSPKEVKEDRKYTKDHEWARTEGSELLVGITAFAVDALGGDQAPSEVVAGAVEAAADGIDVTLFGPAGLDTHGLPLVETTEQIEMHEKAAEAVQAQNANMDLHNAAAWENIFTLKDLIEKNKIMGRPDTVQADRQKMRQALAGMKETQGLLGKVGRTEDREAIKPYVFVQADKGAWTVIHRPSGS